MTTVEKYIAQHADLRPRLLALLQPAASLRLSTAFFAAVGKCASRSAPDAFIPRRLPSRRKEARSMSLVVATAAQRLPTLLQPAASLRLSTAFWTMAESLLITDH
jgi:hypothetical protein